MICAMIFLIYFCRPWLNHALALLPRSLAFLALLSVTLSAPLLTAVDLVPLVVDLCGGPPRRCGPCCPRPCGRPRGHPHRLLPCVEMREINLLVINKKERVKITHQQSYSSALLLRTDILLLPSSFSSAFNCDK
jgi:hypothetical protein